VTEAADEVLVRLTEQFEDARDPIRAADMAAYMRDQFPFLGLPTPERRRMAKTVFAGAPSLDRRDVRTVAARCWRLPEREYQYVGCDLLVRSTRLLTAGDLTFVRRLITTRSWWDTVDPLATRVVGDLVRAHPKLVARMDEWIGDRNIWLARTALLHQLHWKDATDEPRLFAYCLERADEQEFFLRKAIGWALREYSKTAPQAVEAFVRENEAKLSGLSRREALKVIERMRR
jgi:3-methyladenine DNA glycosylase AlkD